MSLHLIKQLVLSHVIGAVLKATVDSFQPHKSGKEIILDIAKDSIIENLKKDPIGKIIHVTKLVQGKTTEQLVLVHF